MGTNLDYAETPNLCKIRETHIFESHIRGDRFMVSQACQIVLYEDGHFFYECGIVY